MEVMSLRGSLSGLSSQENPPIDIADHDIVSLSQVQSQDDQDEDEVPPGEEKDFKEDPDGEEEEEEEDSNNPEAVFDDWMLSQTKDQREMLSVLLYENFHNRQGMSVMEAANESASITGQFPIMIYILTYVEY